MLLATYLALALSLTSLVLARTKTIGVILRTRALIVIMWEFRAPLLPDSASASFQSR